MSLSTLAPRTIAGIKFTSSEWTAGHLERTIATLAEKYPKAKLRIIQPCYRSLVPGGGADASKGTHDFDGVFDVWINGRAGEDAQTFLRACGWAAWHRTPAQGFPEHIHMATIPPGLSGRPTAAQVGAAYKKLGLKVGKYIDGGLTSTGQTFTSSQIVDQFAHAFGLSGNHQPGADHSWFPADIAKTIYKPGAIVEKPTLSKPPAAHTHLVEQWSAHRSIDLHDVSAVELTKRQPYADAAAALHRAVNAAWDNYRDAVNAREKD